MFVLVISAPVKTNAWGAFAQAYQRQLLPSLRARPGFKDEMLFVVPGGPEMIAVSFWESRENADAFEHGAWSELLIVFGNLIDRPLVRGFQLAHSSLHEEGVAAFPIQSPITSDPSAPGA